MKHTYKIDLLPGNHGIWAFVSKDLKLVIEQSGFKTVEEALEFAKGIIKSEESKGTTK